MQSVEREYREYLHCALVFVPKALHATPDAERRRYLLHRNAPDDPGHRAFLSRLVRALAPRLPRGAAGLDYGSGPSPTLATMLRALGFTVDVYDPFFAPSRDGYLDEVGIGHCFVCSYERTEMVAEDLANTLYIRRAIERSD